MIPVSGEQVTLAGDDLSAVVTEVGATLRSFRAQGDPIIWEFPESEIASFGRGQVLAPWPNRIEDGSYRFAGIAGQAALDEPERSNAIHGIVRWMPWTIVERSAERAVLSCVVHPQPAYPFRLRLELEYALRQGGLEITCGATNTGPGLAPFGLGFHPYFVPGDGSVDEAEIRLDAERRLTLDARGLPIGDEPVAGSPFDLSGRRLGGLRLDDCYTGLSVGADGRWRAELHLPARAVEVWADAVFGYAMCFTGDTLGAPADCRQAIAIEPMSCPPNAFRSGESLIELSPGQRWEARWGIRPIPA